jgi:uncharacterized protein YjeT (DUF2065 family)
MKLNSFLMLATLVAAVFGLAFLLAPRNWSRSTE